MLQKDASGLTIITPEDNEDAPPMGALGRLTRANGEVLLKRLRQLAQAIDLSPRIDIC